MLSPLDPQIYVVESDLLAAKHANIPQVKQWSLRVERTLSVAGRGHRDIITGAAAARARVAAEAAAGPKAPAAGPAPPAACGNPATTANGQMGPLHRRAERANFSSGNRRCTRQAAGPLRNDPPKVLSLESSTRTIRNRFVFKAFWDQ